MQLLHLNYKSCPTCGSRVQYEEQNNRHCNGEWNEKIKFDCGHAILYSPNFRCEREYAPCPDDKQEVLRAEKRKLAHIKLTKYIKKLDVDESFISLALDRTQYI